MLHPLSQLTVHLLLQYVPHLLVHRDSEEQVYVALQPPPGFVHPPGSLQPCDVFTPEQFALQLCEVDTPLQFF